MVFGIHKHTDPVKPPKTHDEVVADLLKQLCQGANASLGSSAITLDEPPTIENLRDIYALLAEQRFTQNYGYDYAGPDSKPPNSASNAVSASTAFLDVGDRQTATGAVPDLVQKIISSASIPDWCREDIKRSLTNECNTVLGSTGLINNWSNDKFIGTYPAAGKYDNSFHTEGIFIYVHGSLTEDTITVTRTVLLYIGVYYEVESVAKKQKESLWDSTCRSANKLIPEQITLSTPPTLSELTTILEKYRDQTFPKDFSFSFEGAHSTPVGSVGDLGRVSYLFVFEDENTSSLEETLDTKVIANLKLPTWLRATARADILKELQYCLTGLSNPESWTPIKIDKSYFPDSPNDLTILDKSEIVYCNAVSAEVQDVSYRYIYYSGVFYNAASVHDVVYGDLIKTLCNAGQSMLDQPVPISNPPTQDDLNKVAITVSNSEFKKNFKLDYKGLDTRPEDKSSPSSPLYAYQGFTFIQPGDSDTATDFVDQKILPGLAFPFVSQEPALKDAIRKDLVKEVQTTLQAASDIVLRSLTLDKPYSYSDDSHAPLETKGLFLFANAASTEASQNNYTAHISFVFYTGIYYDQEADEW
ncbi:hypothetical protein AX16_005923 [Volvariella volvacea WC 439]|nr:hypothetical protein AX16_005923 [Volvariella volvacea WC 439]